MSESLKTVIGFDYGSRWTGIAVGQTLTCQARPLGAVKTGDWEAIERVLAEWQPQKLIVGLPLNMKDEKQEMSERAERFGRQLEGRFGITTICIDERLTTREAYTIAIENGQRKSKQEIDSLAAALITESWLRDYDRI
ncbi:MAG TPA: Holliday junction resolvase RuvX [Gammaproteobacteria bacterium]|nr:Holliday junction resolvase RuvX [Gammaproteobacteria bacterium]